ncbi:MAG: tRNA epoxyqueuosine(34) reductase QueG [Acidimicrobiia bacterium]|nr:tRNA epoxyqueuosine(34) reductase QueG [Acidimicrobiia bacterium]
MDLSATLHSAAAEAGLAAVGFASAAGFPEVRRAAEERVAAGFHGGMRFTFSAPERSTDPRSSFPWAQTLLVGAWSYVPEAGSPGPAAPGTGRVARFATRDHYRPLRAALDGLAGVLGEAGHRAEVLCDDSRLVDRAAAVRAGVGWWGKSTMVLAPGHGPWLLLGSVVTDAFIPLDRPMVRHCGPCVACLPACPTGALVAPGVLDARRCLAALAQAPGAIPREFRRAMGDRFYGCDDCLEACPPGRRALAAAGKRGDGRVDLIEVLKAGDAALLERFGHFYLPGREARYLRRNALVALGNSGGGGAVPIVIRYLADPDPVLRAHAAWALGELGGTAGRDALAAAASREADPGVLEEVYSALTGAAAGGRQRRGSVP